MKVNLETIQAVSTVLSGSYVGASVEFNLVEAGNTRSLAIGLATEALTVISATMISADPVLPYVGQLVAVASLANNLFEVIKGADEGAIPTSNVLGAVSDIASITGSITLTLAAETAAVGVAGATLAPALIVGTLLTAVSIKLIADAAAAENKTIEVPQLKEAIDNINYTINNLSDILDVLKEQLTDDLNWSDGYLSENFPTLSKIVEDYFLGTRTIGENISEKVWDFFHNAQTWTPPYYADPLVLDLDNDGIETTSINGWNGVLFDHNNDGVKTATGWLSGDDGFLVLDKDGNGTIDNGNELFGDNTHLTNGAVAADGFAALADLDSNQDGVMDANDAVFANLRVWQGRHQPIYTVATGIY
jgi:hypothetical protein